MCESIQIFIDALESVNHWAITAALASYDLGAVRSTPVLIVTRQLQVVNWAKMDVCDIFMDCVTGVDENNFDATLVAADSFSDQMAFIAACLAVIMQNTQYQNEIIRSLRALIERMI